MPLHFSVCLWGVVEGRGVTLPHSWLLSPYCKPFQDRLEEGMATYSSILA